MSDPTYRILCPPDTPPCDTWPAGARFPFSIIRMTPGAFRGCVFETAGQYYRIRYIYVNDHPRMVFDHLTGGAIPTWALPVPILPFTGRVQVRNDKNGYSA